VVVGGFWKSSGRPEDAAAGGGVHVRIQGSS
jgi:hypothetical protein